MAVVSNTWNIAPGSNWITSTGWVSTDPSYKLHQELNAWVTAIDDSSIINIQATPNDATDKTGGNAVSWILQTRDGDTTSDWGLIFHPRRADTSSYPYTSQGGSFNGLGSNYYARISGSANNGYGSLTGLYSHTNGNEDLSVSGNVITSYNASGTLPWFIYSWENAAKSDRKIYGLFRLDTTDLTENSYYPPSGISKWLYVYLASDGNAMQTPIKDQGIPIKGFSGSGFGVFSYFTPRNTAPNGGFFFRTQSQYADVHYLGKITQDLLVANSFTGVWGDTIVIDGLNYTCIGVYGASSLWIKTVYGV